MFQRKPCEWSITTFGLNINSTSDLADVSILNFYKKTVNPQILWPYIDGLFGEDCDLRAFNCFVDWHSLTEHKLILAKRCMYPVLHNTSFVVCNTSPVLKGNQGVVEILYMFCCTFLPLSSSGRILKMGNIWQSYCKINKALPFLWTQCTCWYVLIIHHCRLSLTHWTQPDKNN